MSDPIKAVTRLYDLLHSDVFTDSPEYADRVAEIRRLIEPEPVVSARIAGVWTPWADVLCRICHEALPPEATAKREIKWPGPADPTAAPGAEERREGDGPGWCTSCGRAVWVHEGIAQLTRLRALAGGEMEQTGGMCSALTLTRMDGGTVVVTNMDWDISIGLYAPGGWEESQEAVQVYCLPANTPDEAAAAVIKAVRIEAREEL